MRLNNWTSIVQPHQIVTNASESGHFSVLEKALQLFPTLLYRVLSIFFSIERSISRSSRILSKAKTLVLNTAGLNAHSYYRFNHHRFLIFYSVGQPLHSSCNLQTGGCDLQNVNWVVRLIFFFSYRLCIQTMLLYFLHPNPPEESWSSLIGFWLFAETMCCCAEGCKVNLDVFEVGVVPHWLSLSSLIAFFISSRSRTLTPRISCTLAHISVLWTVTKAFWGLTLYFFFALPLFDLC